MKRTQAERSQATIRGLIEVARKEFGARGYADTSIEDIVRAAGVTRGALYHHYDTKLELFRAVVRFEQRALTRAIAKGAASSPVGWERLQAGCHLFLEACLNPAVRRILLLDGPAVLGWDAVREIEAQYTLALLRDGLRAAVEEDRSIGEDSGLLASLLFAALAEAGRLIANARHPQQALPGVVLSIDRLLASIRQTGQSAAKT